MDLKPVINTPSRAYRMYATRQSNVALIALIANTQRHKVDKVNSAILTEMMFTVPCQMLCTTLMPT